MEYHFKRYEISGDKILFVLVLDKKASKERVLIGNEIEITKRLWDDTDAGIYYDMTHPLGTLFKEFKRDKEAELIGKGFMPLWNALHSNRWKQPELEESSSAFCSEMYHTGDPLYMYSAIRIWDGYLRARQPRDRDLAAELYKTDLTHLLTPLSEYSQEVLLDRVCAEQIRQSGDDMRLNVWYPARTATECVMTYGSFLPIFLYYHTRLVDWNLYFRNCKACGKVFLAKSQKYSLCSDKCRKKQGTQAKRNFDARAIDNEYDHLYKNECQHWLHYIHKMEKTDDCSPERLSAIKSSYETFRSEAKERKSAVKKGQYTIVEFRDWILQQLGRIM